jgi:hypothetical protein
LIIRQGTHVLSTRALYDTIYVLHKMLTEKNFICHFDLGISSKRKSLSSDVPTAIAVDAKHYTCG